MFVDSSKTKISGKTYWRHLLRTSYREDGEVRHRTVANISKCTDEEIEAIRLALRYKGDLARMIQAKPSLQTRQGLSVGAVWTVYAMGRELGIEAALGPSREGRLALWQVMARVLDQGSRLSAVRLAGSHCACEVLGLEAGFNEEDLYRNLDWLAHQQTGIEKRLFEANHPMIGEGGLFLYDVTSSYLEGTENALSAFGYNRDGKRGKKQIVIGLLTTVEGEPVSVEVFEGNTTDPKTFGPQIRKAIERFGAKTVTFVGDRGMIKSAQIEALGQEGFHYITAITKPQIEGLLRQGTIQMEMFDADLAEVTTDAGVRYVLRRNPARAAEMAACRRDKLAALTRTVEGRNTYLREHARAHVDVALRIARERAEQLNLTDWVRLSSEGRRIVLEVDEAARAEEAKLDGCYVIKTDLRAEAADKQTVHDRYKDLAQVERVFRTSKTVELELRPIYVRLASRTRGHVLVVMLAYHIVRELARRWRDLDTTVQEGLDQLAQLCATEILEDGRPLCCQIPQPRPAVGALLAAARILLPEALPSKGVTVTTKRKLPKRRINR
jgi:hypothetical protein